MFIGKESNSGGAYQLDVNGGINTSDFGLSVNNNKIRLEYLNASTSGLLSVTNGDFIISGVSNITIGSTSVNGGIFYRSNGNIGIGTSSPISKVQVYGTSSSLLNVSGSTGNLVEVINSNTGNLLEIGTLNNKPIFIANTDGNLYFNTEEKTVSSGGGTQSVYQVSALSGNSVFFDYYLYNTLNPAVDFRMGNVSAYWAGTSSVAGFRDNVYFTSGNTSPLVFSVSMSSNLVTLFAESSSNIWKIKATARVL